MGCSELIAERVEQVIRTIPPMFGLFEKLVNLVHEKAPHAKICFNTVPEDTAVSVQRWV